MTTTLSFIVLLAPAFLQGIRVEKLKAGLNGSDAPLLERRYTKESRLTVWAVLESPERLRSKMLKQLSTKAGWTQTRVPKDGQDIQFQNKRTGENYSLLFYFPRTFVMQRPVPKATCYVTYWVR